MGLQMLLKKNQIDKKMNKNIKSANVPRETII